MNINSCSLSGCTPKFEQLKSLHFFCFNQTVQNNLSFLVIKKKQRLTENSIEKVRHKLNVNKEL